MEVNQKSGTTLPPATGQSELLTRVKELQELACLAVAQDQAGQLKASITSYEQVCPYTCLDDVMYAGMCLYLQYHPIKCAACLPSRRQAVSGMRQTAPLLPADMQASFVSQLEEYEKRLAGLRSSQNASRLRHRASR